MTFDDDNKPGLIECPNCGKQITSDMPELCYECLTAQLTEAKTEIVEQNEINTKQGHACVNYLKKIGELKAENARYREALGEIDTAVELHLHNFLSKNKMIDRINKATTALNGEGDDDGPQ